MALEGASTNHGARAYFRRPDPAISLGLALMFGTAGLPPILMRFSTFPEPRMPGVGVLGDRLDRVFLQS